MSALPNSKSSFLRAAQGCGALALAGAMVLPMSPALAQNATADTTATAAASSQSGDRVRENLLPLLMSSLPTWATTR